MKERILENKRNFSSRNFDSIEDYWDLDLLEPSKKVVVNIINGNTFETSDNQFIRIKDINIPKKDQKGYNHAKSDLNRILRKNSTVKVYPVKVDKTGEIIANVEIKSKNVANIMRKKGWRNDPPKNHKEKKASDKQRWQEKYVKSKRNHNQKNLKKRNQFSGI